MPIQTFRLLLLPLLLLLAPGLQQVAAASQASPAPVSAQLLHVSPEGSDQEGDGTAAAPLATVANALTRLDPKRPATIRLLPGLYREQITLPARKSAAALTIEGSDEGEVIFEGGEPITGWSALPSPATGVFRVLNATSQTVRSIEEPYHDVWDAEARVRYRKQADLAGVMAYPASVAVEEEKHLILHTADGKEPRHLWRSRLAFAFSIERDRVTLRKLTFRNYTGGGSAHAVAVDRKANDTVLENCRFENIVCAILNNGAQTRISNVRMKEVSRGIENGGVEATVEDCVIEAAAGRFTFSDNNQHRRNGIRVYYPARGGTIRRNVTVGFWAGLYIKTASSLDNALPILVESNTFLDGVNFGSHQQPKTVFRGNVIGPDESDSHQRLLGIGATAEHNYCFSADHQQMSPMASTTNFTGPVPFADLVKGDLSTTEPHVAKLKMGAPLSRHRWTPAIQRLLTRQTTLDPAARPLRLLSPLEKVASRQGALLFATLNTPSAEVILKVRRTGEEKWMEVPGQINRLVQPAIVATPAPVEPPEPSSATPYLFDLTGGQLAPGGTYEAMLLARQEDGESVTSDLVSFRTEGDPKVIHVDSRAKASVADGTSQHPWPQLQQALDRALPGDTVELAEGVYTAPALLQHGGTPGHPIVVKGQSKATTIFDGGKEASTLLKLENASHVTVTDLTFRWFGDCGLMASGSPSLRVERCHFQNSLRRRGANGKAGLYVLNSPQARIAFNTFTTAENGARLENSPAFVFQNNTTFGNLYAGMMILDSSRDSVVTHNAFTFTGNASLDVMEKERSAWDSITCNFNNYGNRLNNGTAPERPENDFRPSPHYGKVSGKAIVRTRIAAERSEEMASQSFYSMKAWREFSGKDHDSIFADPDYLDPLNNDFRVQPKSPHFLADGMLIGAEGRLLPPSSAAKP